MTTTKKKKANNRCNIVLSKLKVPDLKSELEKRKRKKTGKKQELVDRLVMALERERKSRLKLDDEEDDVGKKQRSGPLGDEESEGERDDDGGP